MNRKTRKIIGLGAAVMALAVLLPVARASAADTVTVSINGGQVALDSNFTLNINISQVQNLAACSYDISFDPAVLELKNVSDGLIGGYAMPVRIWNQKSPGTAAVVQDAGLAGISGSGYIAILNFHVIGSAGQSSQISFSKAILGDNTAHEIPSTWTGGTVSTPPASGTQPATSTPTPPASSTPTLPATSTPAGGTTGGASGGAQSTASATPTTSSQPVTVQSETTSFVSEQPAGSPQVSVTEPTVQAGQDSYGEMVAQQAGSQETTAATSQAQSPQESAEHKRNQSDWSIPVIAGIVAGLAVIGFIIFSLVRRRA